MSEPRSPPRRVSPKHPGELKTGRSYHGHASDARRELVMADNHSRREETTIYSPPLFANNGLASVSGRTSP